MNEYMILTFERQQEINEKKATSITGKQFLTDYWLPFVAETFELSGDQRECMMNIRDENTDELKTLKSLDNLWLYGDNLITGVPFDILEGKRMGT